MCMGSLKNRMFCCAAYFSSEKPPFNTENKFTKTFRPIDILHTLTKF
jgi:hypothetical protein